MDLIAFTRGSIHLWNPTDEQHCSLQPTSTVFLGFVALSVQGRKAMFSQQCQGILGKQTTTNAWGMRVRVYCASTSHKWCDRFSEKLGHYPQLWDFLDKRVKVLYYSTLFSFQREQSISAKDWLFDLLIKSSQF